MRRKYAGAPVRILRRVSTGLLCASCVVRARALVGVRGWVTAGVVAGEIAFSFIALDSSPVALLAPRHPREVHTVVVYSAVREHPANFWPRIMPAGGLRSRRFGELFCHKAM